MEALKNELNASGARACIDAAADRREPPKFVRIERERGEPAVVFGLGIVFLSYVTDMSC